jgi:ribosomal protein L22
VTRGTLASSSIFEDEDVAGPKPEAADGPQGPVARNPRNMAVALDPNPKARIQFEKKMVIKEITKRGRLTKAEVLKRTERELVSRSHLFKTSLKKLRPLATQITGKTVEEAIVQMRFSKKKAAKDVKEHLEHARNEAVVKRGMGLGAVNGEADGFRKVLIVDKDGKRIKVGDPTRMWIEQAWVGKGKGTKTPDYRARGQVFMMDNPRTRKFHDISQPSRPRLISI